MPGICGIIDQRCAAELPEVLSAMQACLTHDRWHVASGQADIESGIALGSVRLDFTSAGARFFWDEATGSGIAIHGELYGPPRQADTLLAGFLREGGNFLRRLNGSFSAAIYCGERRKLTLITDRLGSRPLYYCHASGSLRFGSGLAAVLAQDNSPRRVSPRGLAQFFTFGHYLRHDTALEGVAVLPAATCLTFDADEQKIEIEKYWSPNEVSVESPASRSQWLERIDAALVQAVNRQTANTSGLGLSLSGGLDARTILALIDTKDTPVQSVCMGVRGSLDHRSSRELARLVGGTLHEHVLGDGFLGRFHDHLNRMVRLTDGQYLSQCIVIPTLSTYRELGIQTLLRGHAGELMHMRKAYSYSLDDEALRIRTDEQLRTWLLSHLPAYMLDGVTRPLFARPFQQSFRELAAQSIDEDLDEVSHVERPLDRIWHLFVAQRLRRETVLSMLKFGTIVEPRLPFLDPDLIALLLAAPADLKLGEEIQSYVLGKHRPEFLQVTNANTGAPLGTGLWRQRWSTLQMKILAKLGVPGYQPYERLGLWLRRELAPVVRRILLDERTLDRGVFDARGVQAVVQRHLEHDHNHTYLIMALMIFELGLRRLVDGEDSARFEPGASDRLLPVEVGAA